MVASEQGWLRPLETGGAAVVKKSFILAILLLSLLGCGGVRYSHVAPEAKDFPFRRIALLPADVRVFPDAKGTVDQLFAQVLTKKGRFDAVVGADEIMRRMEMNQDLRDAVEEYLEKLDKLSFSDSELSRQIGRLTDTEALLLVRVDYWHYTQKGDNRLARVGLGVTLVQAQTGKTLWAAGQDRTSDFLIRRPELANMAEGVIGELIETMP